MVVPPESIEVELEADRISVSNCSSSLDMDEVFETAEVRMQEFVASGGMSEHEAQHEELTTVPEIDECELKLLLDNNKEFSEDYCNFNTKSNSEEQDVNIYSEQEKDLMFVRESDMGDRSSTRRSNRSTAGRTSLYTPYAMMAKGYNGIVAMLLYIGTLCVIHQPTPNLTNLMVNATVSTNEYLRRNPKWSQAIAGEDRLKWLAADLEEQRQHLMKPTFLLMDKDFKHPPGTRFLPIKRQCRIKDSGKYKVRWVVLGNLDLFSGDTFAPTASRKIVWLLFAVSVLLRLTTQWFDITGAFMAEKPVRDIYVTMDGKIYKLNYSLYGLGDAPRVFNEGLVAHLKVGGYVQSKWDQCFFIKWVNSSQYIYLVVHVDDFTVFGSNQEMIEEFHQHMNQKYDVTTNLDGVFLGILQTRMPNGDCVFNRPYQRQSIFDKCLPNGLNGQKPPKDPMINHMLIIMNRSLLHVTRSILSHYLDH